MSIVTFKSPSGDDMVVIPRAEYESLKAGTMSEEDILDAAAVIDHKNSDEETYPAEMVERLHLCEDHPIKIYREYRGMKAKDLAAVIDVTPNFLSMIEHRKKEGSLKLYIKIARALSVDLDDLVEWPQD